MKYPGVLAAALLGILLAACATRTLVSFQHDIYPILEHNCLECHVPPAGAGYLKTRLNLQSYATLMEGTQYGPVILPGDSRRSTLNRLVEGRAGATLRMPHNRLHPLTEDEIETLRLWVEQGARNN